MFEFNVRLLENGGQKLMNALPIGVNYNRTSFTSKTKMNQIQLKTVKALVSENGGTVTAYRPGEVRLIVGGITKTFLGKNPLKVAYQYLSGVAKKGRI